MSQLRRLTKEDAVKLSPQLSNLYIYLIPFRLRILAIKKILRDENSNIYKFSDKLFTAITKLPKVSPSDPYLPVAMASNKDTVAELYKYVNQFQTLWQKYKTGQTNTLATQLAGVLVDMVNDFRQFQPIGFKTLVDYRNKYGIYEQDPVIDPATETVANNLGIELLEVNVPGTVKAATVPGAAALPITTTQYHGIYAKKCVDPLLYDTQNIDLGTAILHIVGSDGKKVVRTYCLDADSIKGYLGDLSMVFYRCKPTVPVGAIMIRPESVFPTRIRRLPFDFAVYVYESEIQQIRPGKQYVLEQTNKAVGRIASHSVITGGEVVSAQHCQNEYTHDFIYTVKELGKLPTPTETLLKKQVAAELAEEAANKVAKRAATRAAKTAKAKGSKSRRTRRT